jgi:hypothetical protein
MNDLASNVSTHAIYAFSVSKPGQVKLEGIQIYIISWQVYPPKSWLMLNILHLSRDLGLIRVHIPTIQQIVHTVLEMKLLFAVAKFSTLASKVNNSSVKALHSAAKCSRYSISSFSRLKGLNYLCVVIFSSTQHRRAIEGIFERKIGFRSSRVIIFGQDKPHCFLVSVEGCPVKRCHAIRELGVNVAIGL